jgi:hypothetical protein
MIEHRSVQAGSPARPGSRERLGVLALALGIVGILVVYFALGSRSPADRARNLLPYQSLIQSLPAADQEMYKALRAALLEAEVERGRTAAWPDPGVLASKGLAPFAPSGTGSGYKWSRLEQGAFINYFGQPTDPAAPAWLLEIQEPEPNTPPDTAPLDEEHHQLSDGTRIHTYVWIHPYGVQVPLGFVRQPQNAGWTELYAVPPNPLYYNRR